MLKIIKNKYWPLMALTFISLLAAIALAYYQTFSMTVLMHAFMGIFLLIFSTLKCFNPIQFANGFSMYDLIAKKYKFYAYIYPVLELVLALLYLSHAIPLITYLATIIIMLFSMIGVLHALNNHLKINCPCMGTVLNVPLSTVTIVEDLSMAVMAFILMIILIF